MTKKEMCKQFLTVLKTFNKTASGIAEDWPDTCILNFDSDAVDWKTKKPFVYLSYSSANENNLFPTIKEWRKLQTLYEKIKKESKNVKSKT